MGSEANRNAAVSGPQDDGQGFAGILADLTLAVGRLGERLAPERKPRIPWEACHPVWFTGQLTTTTTTLRLSDLYGPRDSYYWDLRSIAVWGFTAGTVSVFRNSANGEQVAQATVPGEFTWSLQKILAPRDDLIFSVASLTGVVNFVGYAFEVETAWLPEYAM